MPFDYLVFITGFSTSSGLIIAIGAQNAFVLTQTIKKQYGALMAMICALIDIVLITAGMFGMGSLMTRLPLLEPILLCLGTLFLIYLGVAAVKRGLSNQQGLDLQEGITGHLPKLVGTCLMVSLLNPHVYLDTVVLLGSIGNSFPKSEQISFMIGAYFGSIIWFSALVGIGYFSRSLFQKPFAWKILDFAVATMMFFVAILLMLQFVTTYMLSV